MACNAAVCNGHKILHPTGPNGQLSDACHARLNGIEATTRTRSDSAILCISIMKLLAVLWCRRNFLHSTSNMMTLAGMLTTIIKIYITRLKVLRFSLTVADSVGGGSVVVNAIVNFS